MELLQLRYFCVVAKHQNVTKAAAELMISQPSLSKTLRNLERELGQALFERRGKYIRLNRQGEIFYENISKSLLILDDTVSELSEVSHAPSGELHIQILAASIYMSDLYVRFTRRYPYIKLLLSNYVQSENFAPAAWDLRISAVEHYTPSRRGDSLPLLTERMVLAVHRDHPLAGRESVDLAEAAGETFVSSNQAEELRRFCQMAGFAPNIIVECDNGTTYNALLRNRVGISVVPETTLGSMLPPELVCVPLTSPRLQRTIVLSWNVQHYTSRASRLFQQFCLEYFQEKTAQLPPV